MPTIQSFDQPPGVTRVETGAVQFGDDWPGLFIRGDRAMMLRLDIIAVLKLIPEGSRPSNRIAALQLERMAEMIEEHVVVKPDGKASHGPP